MPMSCWTMRDLPASAHRRRILNPALVPERVETAAQPERRDVALPALAEIADLRDDLDDPVVRHAEHLAELGGGAEKALHVGVRVVEPLLDVGARDAELLRLQPGDMGPAHQIEELPVVLADDRTERLLADDVGQQPIFVGAAALG